MTMEDVIRVASLCLNHRLRKDVLDGIDNGAKVFFALRKIMMSPAEQAEEERQQREAEEREAEAKAKDGNRAGKKAGAWGGLP